MECLRLDDNLAAVATAALVCEVFGQYLGLGAEQVAHRGLQLSKRFGVVATPITVVDNKFEFLIFLEEVVHFDAFLEVWVVAVRQPFRFPSLYPLSLYHFVDDASRVRLAKQV